MVGIDNDETKIRSVRGAKAPFHEPGLNNLLGKTIKKKILHVTDDVSMVSDTQLTQIAVGTPSLEDGSIDLTYVKKATQELGDAIRAKQTYHVAVVKSTVVPGTTNTIVRPILEQSSGKPIGEKIGLCSNPEFLREGTAVNDSLHPDVVVIGANDAKSAGTLKNLLLGFHGKNQRTWIRSYNAQCNRGDQRVSIGQSRGSFGETCWVSNGEESSGSWPRVQEGHR